MKKILLRLVHSIVLYVLVIVNLTGCMQQLNESTGEEPVILDIQILDDSVVCLKKEDNEKKLIEIQGENEVLLQTFPIDVDMEYNKNDSSYYYILQNKLMKYSLKDYKKIEICDIDADYLMYCTDHYLLCNDPIDTIVDLRTYEIKNIIPLQSSIIVQDAYKDEFYYWDYSTHEMCSYNCETNKSSVLISYGEESNKDITIGKRVGDMFYYVNDDTEFLYRISLLDEHNPETILKKKIIDISYTGKDIIAAVNDSGDISFCRIGDENTITELAKWDGANYIVNGSCIMTVSENKLAAGVIYDSVLYDINIP